MQDYVTLKSLAQELQIDRSHLRRYVLSKGLTPCKVRTADSRGQPTLALSPEDAEFVRDLRAKEGFTYDTPVTTNGDGFFYVIRVVPDLAPGRVKFGFTCDIQVRLQAHRTSAPTAELVKAWPCRRSWECAAIASVTRVGCKLIANEVHDCDCIDNVVDRCDAFFAIMPDG